MLRSLQRASTHSCMWGQGANRGLALAKVMHEHLPQLNCEPVLLCASAVSIKAKLSTFEDESDEWDGGKRRIGDMDVWLEDDLE